MDKILLLITVRDAAVDFEFSFAVCKGLRLTTELGEGSERNGGMTRWTGENVFLEVFFKLRVTWLLGL